MKILITGNLGYVGPWVTRQLRARYPSATLVGLDVGYFAHCLTGVARVPESHLDVQFFGDVRCPLPDVLAGTDAVVHLAAISNDPIGQAHEAVTLDVNFRASVDLARRAKVAGVRSFVFASSCSVYGFAEQGARTEQSPLNPLTAYAKSKVLTECGLADVADDDFRVTCLRFATACGMSDRLRLDLVLNDFVASAVSTGGITVLSDGSPWRPLINVQDMARAIEWALERESHVGGPYLIVNTGSNEWNYQVRDLAECVADAIPGTKVSINHDAPPDKRSYRVDFSLFRNLAPQHVPIHGLRQTVEDLRRGLEGMRFNDRDFRNSSLVRLQVLNHLQLCGLLNQNLEWVDVPAEKFQRWREILASSGKRIRHEDMIFEETALRGAFVIGLEPKVDERGFFARVWCQREFAARGLNTGLVQASLSYTRSRGTLRGLHYQAAPYDEAKLVRCSRGAIYDVIVDLRSGSRTYLKWVSVTLTAQNRRMLYVPEGFAHGFQTLEDDTEVFYQMTQFHEPSAARGARWDDPAFGIRWPEIEHRVISPKDQNWPPFVLGHASATNV